MPVGVLLGKYFNPDQDAWNKLGLLEGALGLDAFRREIPHRGRASHTPGVASLFLFLPVVLVIVIVAWALGWLGSIFFWRCVGFLSLGIGLDNCLHIAADRIWSFWRKHR